MAHLVKHEEIIVEEADYNSEDGEEGIRLTLEDTGGEYHTYQSITSSPNQRTVMTISHDMMDEQMTSGGQPKNLMENEKRIRREIANSNERRRMQSINAGFQSLRSLLPHHEGEKLSKAAILQQTAQYIIDLEREKTHLLSQNSQLKRLLGQHEVGSGGGGGGGGGGTTDGITTGSTVALKKRKLTDNVIALQTISDSSDEGLGSMSPEPVTLLANVAIGAGTTTIATKPQQTASYVNANLKELNEMKIRLESERKHRAMVEERLRQLERQFYPGVQYIQREVIEHTDNLREEEVSIVEIEAMPDVGPQVVVCSTIEAMNEDEGDVLDEMTIREEVILSEDPDTEYVEVPSRLQPILEAAIKAEPKVEVERINETLSKLQKEAKDGSKPTSGRMYLTSTSRQNLETIVEAIRHLEGDHMFGDVVTVEQQKKTQKAQESPLALTTKQPQQQRKLKAELSPFIQLKNPNGTVTIVTSAPAVLASSPALSAVNKPSLNSINQSSSLSSSGVKTCSNVKTITVAAPSSTVTTKQQQMLPVSISTVSSPASSSLSASQPTPTAIVKVQTGGSAASSSSSSSTVTITSATLKQCRPGVIVAKQLS